MAYKTFRNWLFHEGKDIFGFEKDRPYRNEIMNKPVNEKPITQINLETIGKYLMMHDIGQKEPWEKFINEIHWGKGNGALRVWFGTGFNLMIERMTHDLDGRPIWATKKIYQLNPSGFGGYEDTIANEVIKELERIDEQEVDSPKNEYEDLEDLVVNMANTIRRTAKSIFLFEGIRKVNDHEYIIRLGVRGHGVEAQEQQRVHENQTRVSFDPKTGLIRLQNFNLESEVGKQHRWEIMPNDTDIYFCPTQGRDEMVETIACALHWY